MKSHFSLSVSLIGFTMVKHDRVSRLFSARSRSFRSTSIQVLSFTHENQFWRPNYWLFLSLLLLLLPWDERTVRPVFRRKLRRSVLSTVVVLVRRRCSSFVGRWVLALQQFLEPVAFNYPGSLFYRTGNPCLSSKGNSEQLPKTLNGFTWCLFYHSTSHCLFPNHLSILSFISHSMCLQFQIYRMCQTLRSRRRNSASL